MRQALVLAALIFPCGAGAQSVDCDSAMTQSDMNICAAQAFHEADADLNDAYQTAMDALQAYDDAGSSDSEGAIALRQAQRTWITYRDQACEVEGYPVEGGSIAPLVVAGCLERLTRQRASDLWDFAGSLGG